MATSQPEWEPTEQDLDLYRDTVSERMKIFAHTEDTVLPLDQYEQIWPLWMWKRAVEQHERFIAEFQPHLTAWLRRLHPNASVLSEDHRPVKVFYANLLLRWRWCYFQLLVATEGMPQPLRRRVRLCDLSRVEQTGHPRRGRSSPPQPRVGEVEPSEPDRSSDTV